MFNNSCSYNLYVLYTVYTLVLHLLHHVQQASNDTLESELVTMRDQNSQLANEVSQLNNTIADLRDQLATAEHDITLVKQEASQLQEDNRNKTCASLLYFNFISYILLASVIPII